MSGPHLAPQKFFIVPKVWAPHEMKKVFGQNSKWPQEAQKGSPVKFF